MKNIVLASKSPRRKELLEMLNFEFEILTKNQEEIYNPNDLPENIVKSLAFQKADSIKDLVSNEKIIIGADTIVYFDGIVLGKPKDKDDAIKMLNMLSGKIHSVYTGVCLMSKDKNITFFDETKVYFKKIDSKDLKMYVDTLEPMDKAGSYGIQGFAGVFVEKIEGEYFNVMGLPISKLYEELKNFNK